METVMPKFIKFLIGACLAMTLSGVVMAQTTQPAPSKPKAATAAPQPKAATLAPIKGGNSAGGDKKAGKPFTPIAPDFSRFGR